MQYAMISASLFSQQIMLLSSLKSSMIKGMIPMIRGMSHANEETISRDLFFSFFVGKMLQQIVLMKKEIEVVMSREESSKVKFKNPCNLQNFEGKMKEMLCKIEEIANWIANDESGAAAMVASIAANKTAIEAINNETTGILAVAKKYTDDSIAGLPLATGSVVGLVKVDDKTIQAAQDGTISVKAVSTDLLSQGTQEFVLDGGNASGANVAN